MKLHFQKTAIIRAACAALSGIGRLLYRRLNITCFLLLAAAASAQDADVNVTAKTVPDIRSCMAKNFVQRGALRNITVTTTHRDGASREIKLRLLWKPYQVDQSTRINLRVLAPTQLAGTSYLLVEGAPGEAVYFHAPALRGARRITGAQGAQPILDTDFTYGELKQVQGLLQEGKTIRQEDARVEQRKAYVLETRTNALLTSYERVVSYIDQESCTLLRSAFYAKGDRASKLLTADVPSLVKADAYWYVGRYRMENLDGHSHTQLDMSDLQPFERFFYDDQFEPTSFYLAKDN